MTKCCRSQAPVAQRSIKYFFDLSSKELSIIKNLAPLYNQISLKKMSLLYQLPTILLSAPNRRFNIRFYTDTLQFFNTVSTFLLRYPAENNLQLGISKSMVDTPNRYALENRFLMVIENNDSIELVMIWTVGYSMTISHRSIEQEKQLRRELLSSFVHFILRNEFESLRIKCESYELSFSGMEEMLKNLGKVLDGVLTDDEEAQSLVHEYLHERSKIVGGPTPEQCVDCKMRTYSLVKNDVLYPKSESRFEFKILDINNDSLVSKYVHLIKIFFEQVHVRPVTEEYIRENILLKPQQIDYNFYCCVKGDPESSPVSVAVAVAIPNGFRITYVYTIEEFRGKGSASFLMQSMDKYLLVDKVNDRGEQLFQYLFLYADVDNPIANAIYLKCGYKSGRDVTNLCIRY